MESTNSRLSFHVGQLLFEVEGDNSLVREALVFIKDHFPVEMLRSAASSDGPVAPDFEPSDQTTRDGAATRNDGGMPGLRAFYQAKNPRNDMEKVTIVAYYAREFRAVSEFSEEEIKPLLNEAGERKLPRSIPNTIGNTTRSGYGYMESVRGKRGYYRLTNAGSNLVTHTLEERAKGPK